MKTYDDMDWRQRANAYLEDGRRQAAACSGALQQAFQRTGVPNLRSIQGPDTSLLAMAQIYATLAQAFFTGAVASAGLIGFPTVSPEELIEQEGPEEPAEIATGVFDLETQLDSEEPSKEDLLGASQEEWESNRGRFLEETTLVDEWGKPVA